MTRFRLRSPLDLLFTYLDYRRLARRARGTPGLLKSVFLIEDLHTCFSISIWSGREAIPHFGTNVLYHVEVAGRVFGRLRMDGQGYPEIWSTKWRLASVSNNLSWKNFDLRRTVLGTRG
jgi:hypothetical protein